MDASRKPEPHPALQAAAAREAFVARLTIALAQLQRELGTPVRTQVLSRELGVMARLVREGLAALARAGLAVQTKQGGWLLARDPARITLAQVRSAARISLGFPAQETDQITDSVVASFARAEGAAEAARGESLESFLRRFQAASPVASASEARPLGVGQSARKPA
jgi:DNA-binding IscR family transcriptional regulator